MSKVRMVRGSGHTSLAKRSLGRGEGRRLNTGLMLCEGEARGVWLHAVHTRATTNEPGSDSSGPKSH